MTHSEDDGVTWAPPARTRLCGYPADMIQLQDGRVLNVYGYRAKPMDVRGCTSEDGINWDPADIDADGCLHVPTGSGLGVEFDWDWIDDPLNLVTVMTTLWCRWRGSTTSPEAGATQSCAYHGEAD